MALTPPPQRDKKKQPTEAEIEAVVNRGGAVAQQEGDPETIRHVSARLTDAILRRIDALRSRRPRKIGSPKMGVSVRDWIVEAVVEKLEREEKLAKKGKLS